MSDSIKEGDKVNKGKDDDVVKELAEVLEKTHVQDDDDDDKPKTPEAEEPPKEAIKLKDIPDALRIFASWIETGIVKDILVVAGAGISVAAGIPDFRSPGTGLYDNLAKYNLPFPEAVFDLGFFCENPQPFVTLAKELWPTGVSFQPTLTHCFLTMLARKHLLLRVYSQNIDGLEHLAGLPTDRLVECHGHCRTAACVNCKAKAPDMKLIEETIVDKGEVPICDRCHTGYIKPDIVFFGEGLPGRFRELIYGDLQAADCCLVLGTSLKVAPVSMIPDRCSEDCKRMLINRELVPTLGGLSEWGHNKDEHYYLGDCDESILLLAEQLGWLDELQELHKQVKAKGEKKEM